MWHRGHGRRTAKREAHLHRSPDPAASIVSASSLSEHPMGYIVYDGDVLEFKVEDRLLAHLQIVIVNTRARAASAAGPRGARGRS